MAKRKKSARKPKLIRYFNEQSGKCAYCHEDMTLKLGHDNTAEVEHIIPKSKLKITDTFNEVAACHCCNQEKADKPLREFISKLFTRSPE